jgi:peroxiredoxin (alkyl hydroperoxide reductase subunit C)
VEEDLTDRLERALFYSFGSEGTVLGVEVLHGPIGRNVDELIRQIKAMQIVAANPGKAAPAGWTPSEGAAGLITTEKEDIGRY